jgi:hypothetical protein
LDSGPNLTGALVVWTELFIETCKNCASKIRKYIRVPGGTRINKQTNKHQMCKQRLYGRHGPFFEKNILNNFNLADEKLMKNWLMIGKKSINHFSKNLKHFRKNQCQMVYFYFFNNAVLGKNSFYMTNSDRFCPK